MERPTSEWTGKILKAAGQAERAVFDVNRVLIDDAIEQVDNKTSARRAYIENTQNIGPDYRGV